MLLKATAVLSFMVSDDIKNHIVLCLGHPDVAKHALSIMQHNINDVTLLQLQNSYRIG